MLLSHLKGLIHALADGDTRYHHNELAPAIVLVQLIHGLDIGIGFANAGFHLDGQVIAPFQSLRGLDLIGTLYLLQMLQNNSIAELRYDSLIAPAGKIRFFLQADLILPIAAIHSIVGCQIRLPGKDINDSFGCICLEFLMFELEFHGCTSCAILLSRTSTISRKWL